MAPPEKLKQAFGYGGAVEWDSGSEKKQIKIQEVQVEWRAVCLDKTAYSCVKDKV